MTWPDVWTYLLSPAVVAGIVLALLKYAGNTAIGRWLNRDLEAFKREQQQQIETLKAEQQRELERLRHLLSSRISKIHEKEFEVLPAAWLMLHQLNGAVARAVQAGVQYLPGFRFSPAQLEQFLRDEIEVKRLEEYQADEIRAADTDQKRLTLYKQFTDSRSIDDAADKQMLLNNYLLQNRIFMTDELRDAFEEAHTILRTALIEFSIGKEHDHEVEPDRSMVRKAQLSVDPQKMQKRLDHIEQAIKKRLRYAEAD